MTSLRGAGAGTLREAVDFAMQNGPRPDVIDMTGLAGEIPVTSPLVLDTAVEIRGPGSDLLTLTGLTVSRVFETSARVTIRDLTITDGFAQDAGAILNSGDLKLNHVTMIDNRSAIDGGAIVNEGTLDVRDCFFDHNIAVDGHGGAILARGEGMSIEATDFTANEAVLGLAVFVTGAAASSTFTDCRFYANRGGGVFAVFFELRSAELEHEHLIARCTFTGNLGPLQTSAYLRIVDTLFEFNITGISQDDGTLILNRTTVYANYTYDTGAGIRQRGGRLFMTQCTLSDNRAIVGLGGGLSLAGAYARILQSTITDNDSGYGGGMYIDGAVVEVGQSIVAGNSGDDVYGIGLIASLGHNAVGDSSFMWDLEPTDFPGLIKIPHVGLGALGDNGGTTPIHPVLRGSSFLDAGSLDLAIDALTGEPLLFDQRGPRFPRLKGATVDIGAVERQNP